MIKERYTIYMFTNDIDNLSHTVAARHMRSILYSLSIIASVVQNGCGHGKTEVEVSLTTGCVNFAIVLTSYLHTVS